jgi:N-methylhydantoinase B
VCNDVIEGRVSPEAARADYGVVLIADGGDYRVDEDATSRSRHELCAKRGASPPVIDRGEGYEKMLRGECAPRMR